MPTSTTSLLAPVIPHELRAQLLDGLQAANYMFERTEHKDIVSICRSPEIRAADKVPFSVYIKHDRYSTCARKERRSCQAVKFVFAARAMYVLIDTLQYGI